MRTVDLNFGWQFKATQEGYGYPQSNFPRPGWRPASVPGHIHLDLLNAGMIADPFVGEYEVSAQWVDQQDWSYRTTFEWTEESTLPMRKLQFDGLDTVCVISLNGAEIGSHDNMFVPLEIDVSDKLQSGTNELQIDFKSPVRVGVERRDNYFKAEGLAVGTSNFDERAFVRKAQYMSGWDWGPRLVSCGIWQLVRLVEYSARIVDFAVFQEHLGSGKVRVWSETNVEGQGDLTTSFDGQAYNGDFDIVLEHPKLWWPAGYGDQPLYSAIAALSTGHSVEKKIGLRTIRLVQEADLYGETFEFEVNSQRIWARGANWIPNDSFPSRVTREDYRNQIRACQSLQMNMLRVWGGGLFELDSFYDACDELGILVWQDFPFGCSYYPDGEEAQAICRQESEANVRRLRHRACLALWCGNNENETMWESKWGGLDNSPKRYYGENLYNIAIPSVLKKLDPNRPYIRTSPVGSGPESDQRAVKKEGVNMGGWGDQHYWDVWHGRGDWKHYEDSTARFSSEFGFASACSLAQWSEVIERTSDWEYNSSVVKWHDKTGKGYDTFVGYVHLHYPECKSLEDWTYQSQLNQRDALRFGIEGYRRSQFCKGSLIWQFNDCWPVQSWAVQDYLRLMKPAGFELGRLYLPVVICLERVEKEILVHLANDGKEEFTGKINVTTHSTKDGSIKGTFSEPVHIGAGQRGVVKRIDVSGYPADSTALVAQIEGLAGSQRWTLLADPKEVQFGTPTYAVNADSWIEIKVDGLAYDLIVRDPDDPNNLSYLALPGIAAMTVANGSVRIECKHVPARLELRSLAGSSEVNLQHQNGAHKAAGRPSLGAPRS